MYNFFLQRITATVNSTETKRLLMDLDISMRTSDCPYTVHFYGAMFREGDVMICMEVMDISLDKFYARAFNNNKPIPEDVLGKVAFAVSLFVCNRGDSFMSQDGLRTRKQCQSPMPEHCCNSGIIRSASPRCFPYTITLKSQHVMRDTALEFGPPSGTGKLIPLLLDAGTSSCTRLPPPTDGIFPHLTHGHTCFMMW